MTAQIDVIVANELPTHSAIKFDGWLIPGDDGNKEVFEVSGGQLVPALGKARPIFNP